MLDAAVEVGKGIFGKVKQSLGVGKSEIVVNPELTELGLRLAALNHFTNRLDAGNDGSGEPGHESEQMRLWVGRDIRRFISILDGEFRQAKKANPSLTEENFLATKSKHQSDKSLIAEWFGVSGDKRPDHSMLAWEVLGERGYVSPSRIDERFEYVSVLGDTPYWSARVNLPEEQKAGVFIIAQRTGQEDNPGDIYRFAVAIEKKTLQARLHESSISPAGQTILPAQPQAK